MVNNVDREVIEVYMKVTGSDDVKLANKELEKLQRAMGRPIVIADIGRIAGKTHEVIAATKEYRKELQGSLMDVAKIDVALNKLLLHERQIAAEHRRQQALSRTTYAGLPVTNTLTNPTLEAYFGGKYDRYLSNRQKVHELVHPSALRLEPATNPGSFVARMTSRYGATAKAVETSAAQLLAAGDQNIRDLDELQKFMRYTFFQDRSPLSRLRLGGITIPGVNPRMVPYLMSQLGTSLYGLTPKSIAGGTAYARQLSSIAAIPGGAGSQLMFHPGVIARRRQPVSDPFGMTVRPGNREYDAPGSGFQWVAQSLQAMRRAGMVDALIRLPRQVHPMLGALPANEYLSTIFGNSGSKLWGLTDIGRQAYGHMGFGSYPGYKLQDTRRGQQLLQGLAGPFGISHKQVIPKFSVPDKNPLDFSDKTYFRWAEELMELKPSMRQALMGIYHDEDTGYSSNVLNAAYPFAKEYALHGLGAQLSDKNEIDRTKLINAKGLPAFTLFNKNIMGNELIRSANPYGKYNMESKVGRSKHFQDLYSWLTGPYVRKGIGSKDDAGYYARHAGIAITAGSSAGAYGPEQIIKLAEALSSFARVLQPNLYNTKDPFNFESLVATLGGTNKLVMINAVIQGAVDKLSDRFESSDAMSVLRESEMAKLSPGEISNREQFLAGRRISKIKNPEQREAAQWAWEQKQRGIQASREGLPIFGGGRSSELVFDAEDRRELSGFSGALLPIRKEKDLTPTERLQQASRKQSWLPPWQRRGVYDATLLSGNIAGVFDNLSEFSSAHSNEEALLQLRQEIYNRKSLGGQDRGFYEASQIAGVLPNEVALDSDEALELAQRQRIEEASMTMGEEPPGVGPSTPPSRKLSQLDKYMEVAKQIASSPMFKTALKTIIPIGMMVGASVLGAHFGMPMAGMAAFPFMAGMTKQDKGGAPDWNEYIAGYVKTHGEAPSRKEHPEENKSFYEKAHTEFDSIQRQYEANQQTNEEPMDFEKLAEKVREDEKAKVPHEEPSPMDPIERSKWYKRLSKGRVGVPGAKELKISGRATFSPGDIQQASDLMKSLGQIPGMDLQALSGTRLTLAGKKEESTVAFKTFGSIGAGEDVDKLKKVALAMDQVTKANDVQVTAVEKTQKVMNESADAKVRFITGSSTGNINSTALKGTLIGQTDQIIELEKAFRGLGGTMKTSREDSVEMTGDTEESTGSMLTFNGVVGETGDALHKKIKASVEDRGEIKGQIEMTGKYSNSLDMLSVRWQKFLGVTKELKGLSRGMLQLQMGFLGVYFSLMSVVGMLQTGIGAITSPLSDLDKMIENFAMSNAFASEGALDANKIMADYGLTIGDLAEGWKKMTWLNSTLQTELGAFGAKIFGDPETWAKIESAMGSLHNFLSDPSTIQKVKDILDGIANMMPSLIQAFDGLLTIIQKMVELGQLLDKIPLPGTEGIFGKGKVNPVTGKQEAPTALQAVGTVGLSAGLILGALSMLALPFNLLNLGGKASAGIGTALGMGSAPMTMGQGIAAQSAAEAAGGGAIASAGGVGTVLGLIGAFALLEESTRTLYNANQDTVNNLKTKFTAGGMGWMNPMLDAGQWLTTAPLRIMSGNMFGPTILDQANQLTGNNTLWDMIFPKGNNQGTPGGVNQQIGVTTNVTNVIYGDYYGSTGDKAIDATNKTIKDVFVGAT